MPAVNKVGAQLLLSPHTRDRARALAILRREALAEVYRAALEGEGLNALERLHISELRMLREESDKIFGVENWSAVLGEMVRMHYDVNALNEPAKLRGLKDAVLSTKVVP